MACPEFLQSYFGVPHCAALWLWGGNLSAPLCPGHWGGDERVGGFGGAPTQARIQDARTDDHLV